MRWRQITKRFLTTLLFILSSFLIAPGQPQTGQKYALVIGITGYPYFEEGKRLKYADDDAIRFYNFILTPEGNSFPKKNIKLLTNERAKRLDILEAINELKNKANNKDLVYIFFAGHGVRDDGTNQAYFMPYDADPNQPDNLGFEAELFLRLITRVNAKHLVFFIDACYAGSVVTIGGSARSDTDNITSILKKQWDQAFQGREATTMGFFSASVNQKSWEDDEFGHGLFSYYLLEGLRGAADRDGDGDGKVTASEAYTYLVDQVAVRSKKRFKLQSPTSSPGFDADFPLALTTPSNRNYLSRQEYLRTTTVEAPSSSRIPVTKTLSRLQADLANSWNRYGGLFTAIGKSLQIEPDLALAVYYYETRDRAPFGPDGRITLDFHPELFWRYWGANNPKQYSRYFKAYSRLILDDDPKKKPTDCNSTEEGEVPNVTDPMFAWILKYCYRVDPADQWHEFAGGTDHFEEWSIFDFVKSLDEEAAIKSIYTVGNNVPGAAYDKIGYRTGREMLDSFRSDIRYLIIGYFDYVAAIGALDALRAKNFRRFFSQMDGINYDQLFKEFGRDPMTPEMESIYATFKGCRQQHAPRRDPSH